MPAGGQRRDITGERFGRLVAVRPTDRRQSRCIVWEFICDCGSTCFRGVNNVSTGNSVSCGCVRREITRNKNLSHGLAHSAVWRVWEAMKQRCFNPRNKDYGRYGERGITVCERWRNSFEAFRQDMGPRPPGLTLEREDNDGPYAPDNCVWATRAEQHANRHEPSAVQRSEHSKRGWIKRRITEANRLPQQSQPLLAAEK